MLYFFELHDRRRNVWLYPGLDADLANQPYFILRHADVRGAFDQVRVFEAASVSVAWPI
jgi:hypothetical protein